MAGKLLALDSRREQVLGGELAGLRRYSTAPAVAPISPHQSGHSLRVKSCGQASQEPSVIVRKRFKLPWLDGNTNSRQLPGSFDSQDLPETNSATAISRLTVQDPFKDPAPTIEESVLAQSDFTTRPYESAPSLANPSRRRTDNRGSSASTSRPPRLRTTLSKDTLLLIQGEYTPSTYSNTPPSERDMPSTLPRKDPASYERLIGKPTPTPQSAQVKAKPPTWPMVPLSEVDIPVRSSSLTFHETNSARNFVRPKSRSSHEIQPSKTPSSIGRSNDGTISRRPTVRTRAVSQGPSPPVSPKTQSPSLQTPMAAPQDRTGSSLQRAVTGLHDLMQEALTVASQAAEQNESHEVAQILGEATLALRKANTVQGYMTQPLESAESDVGVSSSDDYLADSDSDADFGSDVSSIDSRRQGSVETMPTTYTKSKSGLSVAAKPSAGSFGAIEEPSSVKDTARDIVRAAPRASEPAVRSRTPTINPPYEKYGKPPRSEKGVLDALQPPGPYTSSSSEPRSIAQTPPILYQQPSADSIVTDWAYIKRVPGRRDLKDGPTSQPEESGMSSVDQYHITLPPAPSQVPLREQINVLVRDVPLPTDEPRQSIKRRQITLPDIPRERTQRDPHPGTPVISSMPQQQPIDGYRFYGRLSEDTAHKRHKPHLPAGRIFESSQYHIPVHHEDAPEPRKNRYGQLLDVTSPNLSLRHPRRNHVSLREDQTFRLHRYRRQPIAREWKTLRKRITAVIACVNTALVGLIAGIYVSPYKSDGKM